MLPRADDVSPDISLNKGITTKHLAARIGSSLSVGDSGPHPSGMFFTGTELRQRAGSWNSTLPCSQNIVLTIVIHLSEVGVSLLHGI
jgi:hypothetical protein